MIELVRVEVRYGAEPVVRETSLSIPEGALVVLVGPTGSGKSTLIRTLAEPPPAAPGPEPVAGPRVSGDVFVDGRRLADLGEVGLERLVGYVPQDPTTALGDGPVYDQVAAKVWARADDPHAGRRRVEETLDLVGLAQLRKRTPAGLSGGEQQRLAIAVALAPSPRVLLLDEPTSALDPVAAEEVLSILHRLVHDVGVTVVMAEHRLERVVHHADAIVLVEAGAVGALLDPQEAMARSTLYPPVAGLGRALRWKPLPLSVRQARRQAAALRMTLPDYPLPHRPIGRAADAAQELTVTAHRLSVRRGSAVVLRELQLDLHSGEVVALMGRNGAGKSTLLQTLAGSLAPDTGRMTVQAAGRGVRPAADVTTSVPQDPAAVLGTTTVRAHLDAGGDHRHTAQRLLGQLAPQAPETATPAELSEGQRMALALAVALARPAPVVLLDEPTRGLDYQAKAGLVDRIRELAGDGHLVVIATHDVELAADVASRVVVLAEGDVVADGPAATVLSGSPAFAPQVAKILSPAPYLTVAQVMAELGR